MSTKQLSDDLIARFQGYLESDPTNTYLQLRLADLYHRAGRFEEAISGYRNPIFSGADARLAQNGLASVFISQHRFDEAEILFRELLVNEPDDPALCFNHGLCLYFRHRWEEACQAFARAELFGLKTADNFSYSTKALRQSGDVAGALQACRKWADAAQDIESKAYMARLLEEAGAIREARKLAMEILKESPNNVSANVILGFRHIEDADRDAAASCFELAGSQEPANPLAWFGMGLVHLQRKNPVAARDALEKASSLAPRNVGIIVTLGWAHIASGDAQGAETLFKRALSVDDSFGEARGGLAAALALQGQVAASQHEIAKARRLNAKGFGAEYAQSVLLAKEGKHAAGADWFASILQMPATEGMKPLIDQIRAAGP